jgi:hypothetical protein
MAAQENNLIFREEQRYGWRGIIIGSILMGLIIAFSVKGVIIVNNDRHSVLWNLFLLIPFGIILPIFVWVLLLLATLEIEVRSDGLYVRLFPFHLDYRKFAADNLVQYYTRSCRPLLGLGGLGVRFNKKNQAYSVSSIRGIQLVLRNGERLLIGSEKPSQLRVAISLIVKSAQPPQTSDAEE